jgi:hypothetical protein
VKVHMYRVRSPRRILVRASRTGGLEVDRDKLAQFWHHAGPIAREHGCYVFAMRFGDKLTVFYVGKAVKTRFKTECFAPHKISIYNEVLAREKRHRRPVLLFVTPTARRGTRPTVAKEIARIEKWLINKAIAVNPHLMNGRLIRRTPSWRIAGVEPRGPGRPSKSSRLLRNALGKR